MDRRTLLRSTMGVSLAAVLTAPKAAEQPSAGQSLDVEALLFDPETPTGGNPAGDVTIVAFFDYNCPYCKASSGTLTKLIAADGKIRIVYKDWPILKASSVTAARFALAAGYQQRYEAAHNALMELSGRSMTAEGMSAGLKAAGVDLRLLKTDVDAHADAISGVLKRTGQQAAALQLPGTPVYLVGPYKVAAALDYQGFADVVADARRRAAEK